MKRLFLTIFLGSLFACSSPTSENKPPQQQDDIPIVPETSYTQYVQSTNVYKQMHTQFNYQSELKTTSLVSLT